MLNTKLKTLSLPLLLLGFSLHASAGVTSSQVKHITYQVPLNKSLLINLDKKVGKISKGNPSIADVLLFPPNQIFLRGKSLGTTNAIIWGKNKRVSMVLDIEVTHNLESLKQKLYELLPNEKIQVRTAQNNIVLSGQVSNLVRMDTAMKLAQGYAIRKKGGSSGGGQSGGSGGRSGGNSNGVINMMNVGGGQQVMLEVKIAEVSRTLGRRLGINSYAQNASISTSSTTTNTAVSSSTTTTSGLTNATTGLSGKDFLWGAASAGAGLFTGNYLLGDTLFNWSLDFSKDTGLATILAEPNLTTLSGQKASFLSGGEFPYLEECSNGNSCSVGFKQFGIGVEFVPVVLDSNRISLNTHVSVSKLTNSAATVTGVDSQEPSLDLREVQTTVELADGQTLSIAGLLSNDSELAQQHTPGLADLPLIGSLFRNRQNSSEKKELLILVTPYLARPIPKDKIRLPTDSYVEPDDMDFYVLGKMESRRIKTINSETGGINGQFGHQINDESL